MASRVDRFVVAVAGLTLLALAIRVVVTLTTYADLDLGFSDNTFYHQQANLLADGQGFIDPFRLRNGLVAPTAAHPPVYSLYLAGWSLAGFDGILDHRLASTIPSALVVPVLAVTARWMAGRRAGIIVALLAALHPALWINDGLILSESVYVLTIALVLLAAQAMFVSPTPLTAGLLSLAISVAALTRAEAVLLFPFLVLPLALNSRPGRNRRLVRMLAVAAGVGILVMGPWVGRNLRTFTEPTVLSVGSGYVLELANCDETYSGRLIGYWTYDCETALPPAGDESVVGSFKQSQATEYIGDHLGDQPRVIAARVGRTFGVFRPDQTIELDRFFERHDRTHLWMGMWFHWFLLVTGAVGVWSLWRRGGSAAGILAVTATAVFASAVSFGIFRYRVGFDVAAVLAAGIGVAWLWERWRDPAVARAVRWRA